MVRTFRTAWSLPSITLVISVDAVLLTDPERLPPVLLDVSLPDELFEAAGHTNTSNPMAAEAREALIPTEVAVLASARRSAPGFLGGVRS